MKPTVINNNSSEQSHQKEPTQQHQNMDNSTANNGQNLPNNDHSRRFPQFRQHGFGFNDPDDDVFANMGLRSRLNRMGNPFDWSTRKRQNGNDPYEHYFRDEVDFPHFGSTWDAFNRMGNKRSQHPSEVNDRSGFFDYLPPEFRQYMPENFGEFDSRRQSAQHPGQHSNVPKQHYEPSNTQQSNSKSNLCDASIQTDDLASNEHTGNTANGTSNEKKSFPNHPNNGNNHSPASSSSTSTPYGNQVHMSTSADGHGAHGSASGRNNQNQYYQQVPKYENPYGRHPYGEHFVSPSESQQNQHAPPQQGTQTAQGIRNVPIFLEGSNKPVNQSNENVPHASAQTTSASQNKPRPEHLNKESFEANEPIPAPAPPNTTSQSDQRHSDQSDSNDPNGPPQTPHTADCISKIQAIQRDVLDLMCAVEQFGGKRGDKEYRFLDEMLTRNLLKLDTIDTNGKESIRLARKEAIKCIQASIAVLEAKSDLHLNDKKGDNESALKEIEDGTNTNLESVETKSSTEKIHEGEGKTEAEIKPTDASAEIEGIENITIDDKSNAQEPQSSQEAKSESDIKSDNVDKAKP